METKKMDVLIEKASIKLMPGEEIHDFTRALSMEGSKYVCKALGIGEKDGGCWMTAAFSDKAIFSSYKRSSTASEVAPNKYHMVKFSRKNGKFSFSDMVEVERKTVYKPKSLKDAFASIKENTWGNILRGE